VTQDWEDIQVLYRISPRAVPLVHLVEQLTTKDFG
jgi:hypothetical protein